MELVLYYAGYNYRVGATGIRIGRSRDCDIYVENIAVSRHHCEVQARGTALFVRDLGSQHGTYVNGRRLGRRGRTLAVGDRLEVADVPLIALEYAPTRPIRQGRGDFVPSLPSPSLARNSMPSQLPNLAPLLRPEDESISVQFLGIGPDGVRGLRPVFEAARTVSPLEERTSEIPNLAPQLRPGDESASVLRIVEAENGHAVLEAILRSSIPPRDLGRRISELPDLGAWIHPIQLESLIPSVLPGDAETSEPHNRDRELSTTELVALAHPVRKG